MQSYHRTENRL